MDLQLYRLSFDIAHFGHPLLEDSDATFQVHRLYSALFLEAIALGLEEELLNLTQAGEILLSDAFFYHYGLYLPKPIGFPQIDDNQTVSDPTLLRTQGKISKKISHILEYEFDSFVNGEVVDTDTLRSFASEVNDFYENVTHTRVQVDEDPYRVGAVYYQDQVELAVIGSNHPLLITLFKSLQYSGLGGKRSSGLGQFRLTLSELDDDTRERITTQHDGPVMLLNSSLPVDEELESSLVGAHYIIDKSSGFAYTNYFSQAIRKHDLYKFKAGSTFSQTFHGQLIDTAPNDFPHPIWNYAIPLFYKMEVDANE